MSTGGPASPRRATATPTYATAWCASSARARGAGGTAPSGRACAAGGGPRQREARGPRDARGGPRGRLQQEARPGLQLLRRRGLQGAGEPREQEFPRRRAQPAVAHRHHRVQAPGRREGLPEPDRRLLRRDARRPGRSGCTPTSASRTRACSRPARRGRRARARRSTRTGAATTAGRSGSGSARRTA